MVSCLSKRSRRTFLRFTNLTTLVVLCLSVLSFSSKLFVKAAENDPKDDSCTLTNGTNYYDLSPLKKTQGEDWLVEGYGTDWKFYINICAGVLYRSKEDTNDEYENIGIYGISPSKPSANHNLGKISNVPIIRGDNLVMEFTDGKYCENNNHDYKRSTAISFLCDKTVKDQGQPKFVSTFNNCAFFFEWRTPAACTTQKGKGGGGSKGGWGVFITIFLIALIVYFAGGIVYNRTVHNAVGLNQIPNWEFWSNTFDFLKDMILIILAQCPVFKPRRRSGGRSYRNLPRDEEHILIGEEFEEH